jgi:hypothetical protein
VTFSLEEECELNDAVSTRRLGWVVGMSIVAGWTQNQKTPPVPILQPFSDIITCVFTICTYLQASGKWKGSELGHNHHYT